MPLTIRKYLARRSWNPPCREIMGCQDTIGLKDTGRNIISTKIEDVGNRLVTKFGSRGTGRLTEL